MYISRGGVAGGRGAQPVRGHDGVAVLAWLLPLLLYREPRRHVQTCSIVLGRLTGSHGAARSVSCLTRPHALIMTTHVYLAQRLGV